jgi:hypothetical protein
MIGTVKTRFTIPDPFGGGVLNIYRPGFYFDLFPALKPYDIGV